MAQGTVKVGICCHYVAQGPIEVGIWSYFMAQVLMKCGIGTLWLLLGLNSVYLCAKHCASQPNQLFNNTSSVPCYLVILFILALGK